MRHGAGPEEDEPDKVETELTRWIKKMDTAIPVEKIAKEAEAEAAKPKVIVAPSRPATPSEGAVAKAPEPTPEEIRAKHMEEIHKKAWEVYQCEKFGNFRNPPDAKDQEVKACREGNKTMAECDKQLKSNHEEKSVTKKNSGNKIVKSQIDRKAKVASKALQEKPMKEFSVEVKVKGKGENGEKEDEKVYSGKLFEKKSSKPKTKKKQEAKEQERTEKDTKEKSKNETSKICSQHAHNRTKNPISFNLSQRTADFDPSANPF